MLIALKKELPYQLGSNMLKQFGVFILFCYCADWYASYILACGRDRRVTHLLSHHHNSRTKQRVVIVKLGPTLILCKTRKWLALWEK